MLFEQRKHYNEDLRLALQTKDEWCYEFINVAKPNEYIYIE